MVRCYIVTRSAETVSSVVQAMHGADLAEVNTVCPTRMLSPLIVRAATLSGSTARVGNSTS
jgi:hypothetical protein